MVYTFFFDPAMCNIVGVAKGNIAPLHKHVENTVGIVVGSVVVEEEGLGADYD